ncbi:MAG: OmpA/MotB family protein [Thermodesulfobacteriota bacterium]
MQRPLFSFCPEPVFTPGKPADTPEPSAPFSSEHFPDVEPDFTSESLGFFRKRKQKIVHWSILWSDVMMTMFVLFLVLYVQKATQQGFNLEKSKAKAETAVESKPKPVEKRDRMETIPPLVEHVYEWGSPIMQDKWFADLQSLELGSNQAVRIILPGDVLFASGQSELKPDARNSLRQIAGLLGNFPYMVNVVGHTDATPTNSTRFGTNWELSSLRACAVARFLIEEMKLPEERFYVSGYAHIQPMYTDTSEESRAANRRVEILITRELPYARRGHLRELPLGGAYNAVGTTGRR